MNLRLAVPTLLAAVALVAPATAPAATLDLPVWTPGSGVAAPCYRGDVLEIRLARPAARLAHPRTAGPTRAGAVARLGVPSVDIAAASLGATLEPEFRGELAPDDDSPDFTAFHLVHLPPGVSLSDALDRFRALPDVVSADPVALLPVSSLPNDSLAFATFWLENDAHPRADIHAPEGWAISQGDTSIVVAIVDTGVIPYHPDLGGRGGERGQMWTNWAEAAGLPGVDDDGDGYVDDAHGWDFVAAGATPCSGEDAVNEDNDPNDFAGHGTAVAGIVGAIPNNGIGLAGVVPRVQLMSLRIGWAQSPFCAGLEATVDMTYAAEAIRYATVKGASVINCSFTSLNQGGLDAAVTAATRAGVVVVAASGNNLTSAVYLGTRDDVIAVSGTDSLDVVWPNAVLGTWVDLSAAAAGLSGTYFHRDSVDSLGLRTPAYRANLNGTSFAAPQVSGAIALLQAQRRSRGLDPLTPAGALLRVRETADDISALNPGITGYGTGRLNLARALGDPPTSLAIRARARTVGPAVVLRYNDGSSRVVYATSDRNLVCFDGAGGDTLWTLALPAAASGTLAAGNFGARGLALFVGLSNGTVFGASDDGAALPGWPVATGSTNLAMNAGVAIGDVDGDGVPDIVCGGNNGRMWAWTIAGALLPGFPFDAGSLGNTPPALADLDGLPGDEIVWADGANLVHAVGAGGSELAGWPYAAPTAPRAPVIARLGGPAAAPAVLVAAGTQLAAVGADGGTRWTATLPGTAVQDPALVDLDGDGADEIALALAGPNAIAVLDTLGQPFAGRPGWPLALSAGVVGPLVAGPVRAAHGPGFAFFQSAGLVLVDDSAQVVPAFPKPGGAGTLPSLAELDGDGATEIAAGSSAADSNVYTYDAGPGTWNAALAHWPAPRGDFGRTASHAAGVPAALVGDRIRPAPVADVHVSALTTTTALLTWTATGDDSLTGIAARAEVRRFDAPPTDADFASGTLDTLYQPAPPPGSFVSRTIAGLHEGGLYWFAVRMQDAAGHASAVVADSVLMPGFPPGRVSDLRALAVSESTVTLTWTATGDDSTSGRPAEYLVGASYAPLSAANLASAPVLVHDPASVDAGAPETLVVRGLVPGRRVYLALEAIDHAQTPSALSNEVVVITPVGGALRGRTGVAIAARPQPATGPVTLDWQGDPSALPAAQWLVVYDLTGRERARFALGTNPGGSLQWDGRDGDRRLLPAGLYFLRVTSGARSATARLVFVR